MSQQKLVMDEDNDNTNLTDKQTVESASGNRKERRKASKIEKRKKKRKEMAEMVRREEDARLSDPEEQRRLQAEEEQERLRAEEERRRFEETERKILEAWERKRALEEKEEEDERRRRAEEEELLLKQNQVGNENEVDDDDGWEYVEVGPPEIIWQGNEIILKKKKIRVKKEDTHPQIMKEDPNRPTSNPLPPQSEAFANHKNASTLSAQQLLETVAQETPNFGTEQDKAHCPFHLKTGACRFGSRCSRIHFYPDKSCTLLIKNMYSGPGLAWEHDEGLEFSGCNDETPSPISSNLVFSDNSLCIYGDFSNDHAHFDLQNTLNNQSSRSILSGSTSNSQGETQLNYMPIQEDIFYQPWESNFVQQSNYESQLIQNARKKDVSKRKNARKRSTEAGSCSLINSATNERDGEKKRPACFQRKLPNTKKEKYTDEEVDRAYEEFYEDVHTEFLKFGEIVNFKFEHRRYSQEEIDEVRIEWANCVLDHI